MDRFFVSCVSHAFASVHCCIVVTSWEGADLLALVGDVYCTFVTFPCGFLGQVWYLSVSFPFLLFLVFYISPRARDRFNQVVEAKRFEGVFLCRKVC